MAVFNFFIFIWRIIFVGDNMQKINVELISNFINKNNLTKTKFCKLCGISLKTLNKFYNNDFSLTIPPLIKVLKVLNISSCDLIIIN